MYLFFSSIIKMENYTNRKMEKSLISKILDEYELKQNNFNPHKPSPNRFMNKLKMRMKLYYKEQYNSYVPSTK
jgi:hypothetical protein